MYNVKHNIHRKLRIGYEIFLTKLNEVWAIETFDETSKIIHKLYYTTHSRHNVISPF